MPNIRDKLRIIIVNAAASISRTAASQRVLAMVYGDNGVSQIAIRSDSGTASTTDGLDRLETSALTYGHDGTTPRRLYAQTPGGISGAGSGIGPFVGVNSHTMIIESGTAALRPVQTANSMTDANAGTFSLNGLMMLLRQGATTFDRLRGHVNDFGTSRPCRDDAITALTFTTVGEGTTTTSATRAGMSAFNRLIAKLEITALAGGFAQNVDAYVDVLVGGTRWKNIMRITILAADVAVNRAGTGAVFRNAAGTVLPDVTEINTQDLAADSVRDGLWTDNFRVRVITGGAGVGTVSGTVTFDAMQ